MAKKLYVSNLSYETTEQDLTQMFSQCGQVLGANLVLDPESGRSKGFGFVEMQSDDEARHAVDRFNGYDYRGRQIHVEFAKDKPEGAVKTGGAQRHENPRRGGGGGSGRR
ncbi:RNA-binding protein [bacterium]|nr:RNA-binding protein [bacterium]